jgi:hypothetical protein
MKKIILIFIILLTQQNLFSWDTTAAKFYPLAIGNQWSYWHASFHYPYGCSLVFEPYHYIISIISDTVISSHKYYKFNNGSLERIDSVTMNVYRRSGNGECLIDSLYARMNNTLYICRPMPFSGTIVVCDTSSYYFAGQTRRAKCMCTVGGCYRLMLGIGLQRKNYCELYQGFLDTLNGCIINGIQYGQMISGITPISTEIPNQFSLSQNYPNPFNPRTNVQFSIINVQYVTLKIFDGLGREVATLVNEQLHPGTYEVDWDGTNFPSGVYYYRIETIPELVSGSGFRETKKMVLMK